MEWLCLQEQATYCYRKASEEQGNSVSFWEGGESITLVVSPKAFHLGKFVSVYVKYSGNY